MTGSKQLIVVLGAGASFDCSTSRDGLDLAWRPPLVTEIFDKRFEEILLRYPLATQIAPEIRLSLQKGAVQLETFLRERIRDSPHEHYRQSYADIPLYLQDLLWQCGSPTHGYTRFADNYARLVMAALKLDRVSFVTLNYDTLLDTQLEMRYGRFDSMESYISVDRRWSLIKPHGSINWGYRVSNRKLGNDLSLYIDRDPTLSEWFENAFELSFDQQIEVASASDLRSFRARGFPVALYYPALAVPLGPEDENLCPEEHLLELRDLMKRDFEGHNLLIIGYSGLDQEIMKMLAWSGRPFKNVMIVNGDTPRGTEALQRLKTTVGFSANARVDVFPGGFHAFAQSSALDDFIESIVM
jgi:hypothetical protein